MKNRKCKKSDTNIIKFIQVRIFVRIIFYSKELICHMNNANYIICDYIYKKWILPFKSQRAFAIEHNIEESIVRKIKNTSLRLNKADYNIPVNTLAKICEARNIKLSEFFTLIKV